VTYETIHTDYTNIQATYIAKPQLTDARVVECAYTWCSTLQSSGKLTSCRVVFWRSLLLSSYRQSEIKYTTITTNVPDTSADRPHTHTHTSLYVPYLQSAQRVVDLTLPYGNISYEPVL